jgi:hypothetical protein
MQLQEIITFAAYELGLKAENLSAQSDLYDNTEVNGVDCFELEEALADKYDVDMSEYLWYFHHGEGYPNIGGLFIKPPHKRVTRIPVTPALLLESVNSGKWAIDYPPHAMPEKRHDVLLSYAIMLGVTVAGLWMLL